MGASSPTNPASPGNRRSTSGPILGRADDGKSRTRGGVEPYWSPKGDELFYRNGGALLSVSYSVEDGSFQAGTSRERFKETFLAQQVNRWYDVFPDGEHFLMMQTVEGETREPVFIVNWFDELERLVPTDK